MVTKEDWTALRTGAVCLSIFYLCYGSASLMEIYIQDLRDFLGKASYTDGAGETKKRAPIKLGPHSYKTLVLSVASLAVILSIIWLIKVIPFERLFKFSPIHKLVNILVYGIAVEQEDEVTRPSEDITAREQILNTCVELERRISCLEETLTPLSKSLEILSQRVLTYQPPNATYLYEEEKPEVTKFQYFSDQQSTAESGILQKMENIADNEVTNWKNTSLQRAD